MANILDEFNRERLAIRVRQKLNSADVINAWSNLFILRGDIPRQPPVICHLTPGKGLVDFMDVYLDDTTRLAMFTQAIGDGVAKDTKRKVPAISGAVKIGDVELRRIGRKLITVRVLVDDVCIRERSLSAVLTAHGWRATGKNRMTLRAALCAALGRMQGI